MKTIRISKLHNLEIHSYKIPNWFYLVYKIFYVISCKKINFPLFFHMFEWIIGELYYNKERDSYEFRYHVKYVKYVSDDKKKIIYFTSAELVKSEILLNELLKSISIEVKYD